jgi:hypothetical protein
MKKQIILIRIAGFICLLFLVFHAMFHRLFDWPNSLSCLSQINRSIMLTYHYISILILSFMTLVSLIQTKSLLESKLKYSILGMFSLFFIIRIITEFTLFGFGPQSPVIIILCTVPFILFLIPIFYKSNEI